MENILRALREDYVDLYQIHGWGMQNSVGTSAETLAKLQVHETKCFIGVFRYGEEQANVARQTAPF